MVVGVIPARLASTRLFAKPLAEIGGKPMILHTYESASRAKLLDFVIVATDDTKIYSTVVDAGGKAILTPDTFETGSDRIAWTVNQLGNADIVVNIQGDEPFIHGAMIDQAVYPLLIDNSLMVSTLVRKIESEDEYFSPSIVKVVFDYENYALYFSRAPIPYIRNQAGQQTFSDEGGIYKHVGLYVYRYASLMKFTSLEPTALEKKEKLEQLRMLEHGIRIKVVETQLDSVSVDTPEDLEFVRENFESLLKKRNALVK